MIVDGKPVGWFKLSPILRSFDVIRSEKDTAGQCMIGELEKRFMDRQIDDDTPIRLPESAVMMDMGLSTIYKHRKLGQVPAGI